MTRLRLRRLGPRAMAVQAMTCSRCNHTRPNPACPVCGPETPPPEPQEPDFDIEPEPQPE